MYWTITISIIALLLGLTAIIMSIMWHGVKGPDGALGRNGKDVSRKLKSAVIELDALKTTVKTLSSQVEYNKNTMDSNKSKIKQLNYRIID